LTITASAQRLGGFFVTGDNPTMTDTMPRMISRREYADLVGKNVRTIGNWEREGHGPQPIRINTRVYYKADEVRQFLQLGTCRRAS
jgi:predicted DNA-binding transcriptional regulator AlpA